MRYIGGWSSNDQSSNGISCPHGQYDHQTMDRRPWII